MPITHKSTVYAYDYILRGKNRTTSKNPPTSPQFRFLIRLAHACHSRQIPYSLEWGLESSEPPRMRASISVTATSIPDAKPLPKPKPDTPPPPRWKPSPFDAEFCPSAFCDGKGVSSPGFVLPHPSGLSLVHSSPTAEHHPEKDLLKDPCWLLTHTPSGHGLGLPPLPFRRAVSALLHAASFLVDWTQDASAIKSSIKFRRAAYSTVSLYSNSASQRYVAKSRLDSLSVPQRAPNTQFQSEPEPSISQ